jgi:hypothetical protein
MSEFTVGTVLRDHPLVLGLAGVVAGDLFLRDCDDVAFGRESTEE